MERVLTPEWLDEMGAEEAAAVRSRADLRRLNYLMGHVGTMGGILAQGFGTSLSMVELGAGDGSFMLRLARNAGTGKVVLVDRRPWVSAETQTGFGRMGWKVEVVVADVFAWLPIAEPAEVIVANLFLHHFEPEALARLLALAAAKCSMFIACEPRRGWPALAASRLLWAIGCNAVTRHDAVISVRAGFRDRELSSLWTVPDWSLQERRAGLFSHLFVARKNARAS